MSGAISGRRKRAEPRGRQWAPKSEAGGEKENGLFRSVVIKKERGGMPQPPPERSEAGTKTEAG